MLYWKGPGTLPFVEPLDISLGFNLEMQPADTIQYIPLYKSLNLLLSHKDALSEELNSHEVKEDDHVSRT